MLQNSIKNKIGVILFFLLCLSAITGYYTYFVSTKLAFIRIMPMVVFCFLLCLPKLKYDKPYYYAIGFFLIYTVYTIFISIFYVEFIQLLYLLNYVLGFVIVYCSLTLIYIDAKKYLYYFFLISCISSVALSAMAWFEYFTNFHLSASFSCLPEHAGTNYPCAFWANPNDFAVVLSLFFTYALAYKKNCCKNRFQFINSAYILLICSTLLLLRCKTALLVVGLFLIFYFRQFIKKHKIVWLIFFLGGVAAMLYLWFIGTSFSTNLRLNLYRYAFKSLFDSYFLGFGAGMERYYFTSLDNYSLFRDIINTHSFILEMLISSGLIVFLLYVALLIYIEKKTLKIAKNEFVLLPILYVMLLFAPSSSVDLWIHYIFFAVYVGYIHCGKDCVVPIKN